MDTGRERLTSTGKPRKRSKTIGRFAFSSWQEDSDMSLDMLGAVGLDLGDVKGAGKFVIDALSSFSPKSNQAEVSAQAEAQAAAEAAARASAEKTKTIAWVVGGVAALGIAGLLLRKVIS